MLDLLSKLSGLKRRPEERGRDSIKIRCRAKELTPSATG